MSPDTARAGADGDTFSLVCLAVCLVTSNVLFVWSVAHFTAVL